MAARRGTKDALLGMITTAVFALALASPLAALNSEVNRSTLRGLQGVRVLIEDLPPEFVQSGVTKEKLQADMEGRLKKAGIRILTQEECLKTPGEPYLYLNINLTPGKGENSPFAYSVDLALIQNVILSRDPKMAAYAITWSTGGVGILSRESLGDLSMSVADIVVLFIESHQSVNRK